MRDTQRVEHSKWMDLSRKVNKSVVISEACQCPQALLYKTYQMVDSSIYRNLVPCNDFKFLTSYTACANAQG